MAEHEFLQHLRKDHEAQKRLGKQLVEATAPDERDRLRKKFYASLYPHMIGEEASMFKLLTESDDVDVRDDALEGLEEHHVAKMVMKELMDIDTQGDLFKAKAKVLDELNRHHIEEEEDEIFNHLRERCSDDELNALFEQYEDAEEKVEP